MYTSIMELPTQVTSSLDNRDAKKWMDAYNDNAPKSDNPKEVMAARRKAWEAVKNAPSSFSFCIKASIEDIDKDREIIDIESIKEHMDSFIQYGGNVQHEHGNYNVATIWGWDPTVENGLPGIIVWGNVFGGDQVYDEARKAFVNGRNSLSVAGEATEGKFQCDGRGCYTRRYVKQLLEISLCDVPANRHATMLWYNKNAKLTKSASVENVRLNVDSYELHKDYTECPIQALKKTFLDEGYVDVHARDNGVLIKMDKWTQAEELTRLFVKGYDVMTTPEGLLVNSKEKLAESAFKKAYSNNWIDETGKISPDIPESEFKTMYELGWIDNGRYLGPL